MPIQLRPTSKPVAFGQDLLDGFVTDMFGADTLLANEPFALPFNFEAHYGSSSHDLKSTTALTPAGEVTSTTTKDAGADKNLTAIGTPDSLQVTYVDTAYGSNGRNIDMSGLSIHVNDSWSKTSFTDIMSSSNYLNVYQSFGIVKFSGFSIETPSGGINSNNYAGRIVYTEQMAWFDQNGRTVYVSDRQGASDYYGQYMSVRVGDLSAWKSSGGGTSREVTDTAWQNGFSHDEVNSWDTWQNSGTNGPNSAASNGSSTTMSNEHLQSVTLGDNGHVQSVLDRDVVRLTLNSYDDQWAGTVGGNSSTNKDEMKMTSLTVQQDTTTFFDQMDHKIGQLMQFSLGFNTTASVTTQGSAMSHTDSVSSSYTLATGSAAQLFHDGGKG